MVNRADRSELAPPVIKASSQGGHVFDVNLLIVDRITEQIGPVLRPTDRKHGCTVINETVAEMRSDKACAPCNQDEASALCTTA